MDNWYRDMFYEMSKQQVLENEKNMQNGIISLFSGAGGMDLGFEKAGFKTIWANEYDKSIAPSFQGYFKDVAFDGRSITEIKNDDIPSGVGVIGGPPCQSWSEAGARRGIDDPRGQLFNEYIRVIKHVQPLFFVAENVHGLIHSRNKASFDNILKMLEECGYQVSWKLLTASDYGVPQDRQRVFIVGYHNKLSKRFIFPEPLAEKLTLRHAIGDMEKLKIGSKKLPNHEISSTGYSPMFMSRNRVRSWDEQSFTILACDRHTPLHPQAPKMISDGDRDLKKFVDGFEEKYRRFTVRECARIQTFPDDYIFKYSHVRNGYKMIGNAVPVELAKHIANAIKKDIDYYHGNTN
jgi:DNA (cytosine-5)-methyltransferase 1